MYTVYIGSSVHTYWMIKNYFASIRKYTLEREIHISICENLWEIKKKKLSYAHGEKYNECISKDTVL